MDECSGRYLHVPRHIPAGIHTYQDTWFQPPVHLALPGLAGLTASFQQAFPPGISTQVTPRLPTNEPKGSFTKREVTVFKLYTSNNRSRTYIDYKVANAPWRPLPGETYQLVVVDEDGSPLTHEYTIMVCEVNNYQVLLKTRDYQDPLDNP